VSVPTRHRTTQGTSPLKSARERMDIVAAFEQMGTYRGAAALCGTTHMAAAGVGARRRSAWGSLHLDLLEKRPEFHLATLDPCRMELAKKLKLLDPELSSEVLALNPVF
jgi:hypothetical protein